MKRRYCHRLLAVFLMVFLSGCFNSLKVKEVSPGDRGKMSSDEAVIFGRVRLIENGKEKDGYSSIAEALKVTLVRVKDDKQTQATRSVREDGTFAWRVPQDTYLLTRLEWQEFRGSYHLYPQIAFEVGDDSDIYYLGTLEVKADIDRPVFLKMKVKSLHVQVRDEFDKDTHIASKQIPGFERDVQKALMIHDRRLPLCIADAEWDHFPILHAFWILGFALQNVR